MIAAEHAPEATYPGAMPPTDPPVTIRPRRGDDVDALVEVLAAQQPFSGYPVTWPLPHPAREFIERPFEISSWVAEVAGRPVGHVAVTAVVPDNEETVDLADAWARGAGRPTDELQCVSALFLDHRLQGKGIGGRLLGRAVDEIRAAGCVPVLDIVHADARAMSVYRHLGWREVGRIRPRWLPEPYGPPVLMVLDD